MHPLYNNIDLVLSGVVPTFELCLCNVFLEADTHTSVDGLQFWQGHHYVWYM